MGLGRLGNKKVLFPVNLKSYLIRIYDQEFAVTNQIFLLYTLREQSNIRVSQNIQDKKRLRV